jgi:hypothetical protein
MQMTAFGLRSLAALALAVAVLAYPATALAAEEEGTAAEGAQAGQTDGRANTNGTLWAGAGCLLAQLGLAAAYLYTSNPPATPLLGKSPEYVAAYTDAYVDAARQVRTSNAWIGCVATSVVYLTCYIFLGATLSQWH